MNESQDVANKDVGGRLNELLAAAGLLKVDSPTSTRFETYLVLLLRWNSRLNLTAIRDREGILSRHFVESIACARALPQEIGTLLDFGSGAGFPGIPIALCRPEISVTLAESQTKKAAFLREALRTLGLNAAVWAKRAETLPTRFDCVVMRAVDRMEKAIAVAVGLVSPGGWLVLMTTNAELKKLQAASGEEIQWARTARLTLSEDQIIAIGARAS
jgi:16S rRNA (guanine527-N7)-methyltransferase